MILIIKRSIIHYLHGDAMKIVQLAIVFATLIWANNLMYADKFTASSHSMIISGTSTLHDWEAPAKTLTAKGDISLNGNDLQNIASLSVVCESKSIKSAKGESMDEKIYEALKADDYSSINYTLSKVKSITKTNDGWSIETSGNLTIAGQTREIDLSVKAIVKTNGEIQFIGKKALKLSTFNISRPSAMMGMIKCGDDIVLTFTVTMKKS